MSNDEPGFHQISEIVNTLTAGSQQLKSMISQLRIELDTLRESEINQVRFQAEMDKREALMQQRVDIVSVLRRSLSVDQDVIFQQILSHLQMDSPSNKACSNCGREAYMECTACRRSWYCTSFCQQRDWPIHQHHCTMIPTSESIMASTQLQGNQDDQSQEGEIDNVSSS